MYFSIVMLESECEIRLNKFLCLQFTSDAKSDANMKERDSKFKFILTVIKSKIKFY